MPDDAFVQSLVAFAHELRDAGVSVGSGDVVAYTMSVATLDPGDLVDVYWGGRTTLVARVDDIPVYDRIFRRFFLDADDEPDEPKPFSVQSRADALAVLQLPEPEPHPGQEEERETSLGLLASDVSSLRSKSFAACTPDELAVLHRIMRRIRLTPPRRRSRRTTSAPAGRRPDLRRMIRESMRLHGEPPTLSWRRRRLRVRPLILILDVSGSMADYSRSLVQFAYSTARSTARVEVFCFGTRLTRITRELDHRRPDEALDRTELDADTLADTLGAVVKERDDLDVVQDNLEQIASGA